MATSAIIFKLNTRFVSTTKEVHILLVIRYHNDIGFYSTNKPSKMETTKKMFSEAELTDLKSGKLDIIQLISQRANALSKVNASLFFEAENNEGYFKASEFLLWIQTLTPNELKQLDLLLEYMRSGQKLNSLPYTRKDKAGRDYMWCKFALPHANQDFKVVMGGNLEVFIKHYQQGLVTPNFDLNQLYLEALEANS
jgi:hypothetical protein